jgi:hypothetical protein
VVTYVAGFPWSSTSSMATWVMNRSGAAQNRVTLNIDAEEFDKAMHLDDLMARINKARFGTVEPAMTDASSFA